MRALFTLIISLCFCLHINAQRKKHEMQVIAHKAKLITYFTRGKKDEIGTDTKIVFNKDLTLYISETHHYRSRSRKKNIEIKGDTIIDHSIPKLFKKTYTYRIIRNGEKTGLAYQNLTDKGVVFNLDTILNDLNMGEAQRNYYNTYTNPQETIRKGNITIEKFYDLNDSSSTDTTFLYYNDELKPINFSLSPAKDSQSQSKLQKILYLVKHIPKSGKGPEPYRMEAIDEFNVITAKCSRKQLEHFRLYFEKFKTDHPIPD